MNDKNKKNPQHGKKEMPEIEINEAVPATEAAEADSQAAEVEKLGKELAETKNLLLRTAAEFDNFRKRTEREKQTSIQFGMVSVLEKILPVLDTLELAESTECKDPEYKKGVEMTLKAFKSALDDLGIEEIEAENAPFDPNFHAAVANDDSGEHEPGTVAKVLKKGYKIGDRVIRYSIVSVAS